MSKIYIDSITGRRVSKAYASANPTTTQSQTVKPRTESSKLLSKLKKAIAGLMYLSESDYPFEVFKGKPAGRVTEKVLLEQINRTGDKCEERDFKTIFDRLDSDTEKTEFMTRIKFDAKFRRLRRVLESMECVKVFAVGEIQVHLYFVGLSKDGVLCGVSTISIET